MGAVTCITRSGSATQKPRLLSSFSALAGGATFHGEAVTDDEIEKIIFESGNSFHCRVERRFKELGWTTMTSPYYMDASTNKPREIDLVVEKAWPFSDGWRHIYGTVNIKLFVECKYIPQPNVFWFSEKNTRAARNWVTSNTLLEKDNMYTDEHHYLSGNVSVAKLFASKNKPNTENEVIFKALNQSLNAMVYLRHSESIIPPSPRGQPDCLARIEMPVIICNSFDSFYRTDMDSDGEYEKIDQNFQLEVNYAYMGHGGIQVNDYFLIDIVDYGKLDTLMEELEKDVEAIFKMV